MSEEEKVIQTEEELNIDNVDIQEPKEEKTVPLSVLIEERKKYQAKVAELTPRAEIADRLAKVSKVDVDGLRKRIDEIEAGEAQKQYQQSPVPAYQQPPTQYERDLRELRERLDTRERELELDKFVSSGLIDIDQDMKDDILSYAKSKNLTVKEAAFARYGDAIVGGKQKAVAKENKNKAAEMAFSSAVTGGNMFGTSRNVELSNAELQAAKTAGISPEEYALFASSDPEAIHKYYRNKK